MVHAQEAASVVAPEVVVTATRFRQALQDLPVGVTVITQQQIRDSAAVTVPELLRQLPGINVRDNSGSPNWQVDMRGFGIFGDQNTLVLLDGQRISENEQATVNWEAIPMSAIERIEVLRGSGAVLYGGGATGGTINIITKTPVTGEKSAYAGVAAASYSTYDYRAGGNYSSGGFGLSAHADHLETDNYRDSNRLRVHNAQADFRLQRDFGTLYAKLGADDQHLLLPGSLTEAQIAANPRQAATPGDFTHSSGGYANLGGEFRLADAELALNLGYRGKTVNSAYFVATPFRNNIGTQVSVLSATPRAKIPYTVAGMKQTLTTGIDWDDWDYDSTAGPSVTGHPLSTQRNAAWYFQNTSAIGESTTASAGLRLHHTDYGVNDILNHTSDARDRNLRAWELALRHNIGAALSLYGKFGMSFRVPNVNDIYNLFTAGITMLDPQTSHDRELGVEWHAGRTYYRATAYEMDTDNEIHLDPIAFNNVNLPPTRRYGLELEGRWSPLSALDLYANYTYAVAEFRSGNFGGIDVSGKDVPLVPRNKANAGALWRVLPHTRLNVDVAYVGPQLYDSDETNTFGRKMPAYTLVDLKLTREAGAWTLSAGAKNLLNRSYYTYGVFTGFPTFNAYPAPERSFFASAQYNYM
jgi:iron complex outermembrane receptor protein